MRSVAKTRHPPRRGALKTRGIAPSPARVAPPPSPLRGGGPMTLPSKTDRMNAARAGEPSVEEIETRLFLDAVRARYGFDFRDYDPDRLAPRLGACLRSEKVATLSALQERVLRDPECMERCLLLASNLAAPMFHDPRFLSACRETVVPLLKTWPYPRVWKVGCSPAEDLYATVILLHEEDAYERTLVYATDLSGVAIRRAEDGILPLKSMKAYAANHLRSGGRSALSNYYAARRGDAVVRADLKRNIVFSRHNLVTDGPFNEFNWILCRDVTTDFKPRLRDRVLRLLDASLCRFGILGLGSAESLDGTGLEGTYEPIDPDRRLFRKVR